MISLCLSWFFGLCYLMFLLNQDFSAVNTYLQCCKNGFRGHIFPLDGNHMHHSRYHYLLITSFSPSIILILCMGEHSLHCVVSVFTAIIALNWNKYCVSIWISYFFPRSPHANNHYIFNRLDYLHKLKQMPKFPKSSILK